MRIQKMTREYLALEYIPLSIGANISSIGNNTSVKASKRGCPRRFRVSGVCFSDSKYYFEEVEISIKVNYEFGDYADSFILKGRLIGDGVDLNVDVVS